MGREVDFSAYGSKGAEALYRSLTPEQRVEKARAAATARWRKTPKHERTEAARRAVRARWRRRRAKR